MQASRKEEHANNCFLKQLCCRAMKNAGLARVQMFIAVEVVQITHTLNLLGELDIASRLFLLHFSIFLKMTAQDDH